MNLIELARQLGEEIQNDELYIKVRMNEQKLEIDEEFQNLMKEFNEEKMQINEEMSKDSPDQNRIDILNKSIGEKYEKITKNPNMIAFQESQKEFMEVINKVSSIILKSAQGESPYSDGIFDNLGCEGSCDGCSGCN